MEITWYINDGYAKKRPQKVHIDEEDLYDHLQRWGRDALDDYIFDCVSEEFHSNFSFYYEDVDKIIERLKNE